MPFYILNLSCFTLTDTKQTHPHCIYMYIYKCTRQFLWLAKEIYLTGIVASLHCKAALRPSSSTLARSCLGRAPVSAQKKPFATAAVQELHQRPMGKCTISATGKRQQAIGNMDIGSWQQAMGNIYIERERDINLFLGPSHLNNEVIGLSLRRTSLKTQLSCIETMEKQFHLLTNSGI